MKKHVEIRINGIVQGVGFRPFVYKTARIHTICGYVINDTEGVLIHAEAGDEKITQFVSDIQNSSPVLAHITSVEITEKPVQNFASFTIEKSVHTGNKTAFYSPDIALCSECRQEYFDTTNRRCGYPFITCINCGPRFSIIKDVPYDRSNTSMDIFPMCSECQAEYDDPLNRRHHTQPNACPVCGPHLVLGDANGVVISNDDQDIVHKTKELLSQGFIIAIKGIGGYHLAVDALNDNAVQQLRNKKRRPFKPFALMYATIEAVEAEYYVSDMEKQLLLSKERPIVLLKTKNAEVSQFVAPGLSYQGIMLPYTPLHYSLLAEPAIKLVMTSGNISDEPIVYQEKTARDRLGHIADYFVTYNRDIIVQSDDSVLMVENEKTYFIRRSRGYVPAPFFAEPSQREILALGGDLKNCFAFTKNNHVIVGHYLGDMGDAFTFKTMKETMRHFTHVFDLKPQVVACDMHPGYFTSNYANEFADLERIVVQHHHAHIASVLEDQNLNETVIGLAFDGTGYGTDGNLWGSEFLVCDRASFKRAGHFSYFPLPGGESAIMDVWKTGAALLYRAFGEISGYMPQVENADLIIEMIEKKINSPLTCSIGRIFDGVSAILGLAHHVSTEAEAAILLEEAAYRAIKNGAPFDINMQVDDDIFVFETSDIVKRVIEGLSRGERKESIAYSFHAAIAEAALRGCVYLREKHGLQKIVLSGGVFHNRLLLRFISGKLTEAGFMVITPEHVPFNDGCIAFGQVAVARELIKK